MADTMEAAGALATAGLAAHSLDNPSAGAGQHGAHPANCANCGAALGGEFCSQCGQRAHLHRTMHEVFHEFLHGITHFDGKAWKTLPMLLFRPGQLTRSYIEGHRARYIAPVPLFLLVVFTMFFVLSFVKLPDQAIEIDGTATPAERTQQLSEAMADIDAEIAAAEAAGDQAEVVRLKNTRAGIATVANWRSKPDATPSELLSDIGEGIVKASEDDDLTIVSGVPGLDEKAREAMKNPKLLLYKLQTKAYKLSFLLVPLSLPWLWLAFFWRRGIGMYDHAIFSLYSISFISLLFIVGSLAFTAGITADWFWNLLLFAPAVHMLFQLRGAYAIGWWSAAWRTAYLSVAAVFSLTAYLLILIVLGLLD